MTLNFDNQYFKNERHTSYINLHIFAFFLPIKFIELQSLLKCKA